MKKKIADLEATHFALVALSNELDRTPGHANKDQRERLAQFTVDLYWEIEALKPEGRRR